MHYPLPAQRARRGGAGPGNSPAGDQSPCRSWRSSVPSLRLRGAGAGVIGTISSPSARHDGVPEERRNQLPSVSRSWHVTRLPLRGRRRGWHWFALVRGTAPAWSGSSRWPPLGGARRPRPPSGGPSAADARIQATDVPVRPDLALEADGTRRFDEGPLEVPIDVPPELAVVDAAPAGVHAGRGAGVGGQVRGAREGRLPQHDVCMSPFEIQCLRSAAPSGRRVRTSGLSHSITLSAWIRSVGGMVIPRALAVLRLITNWNVLGCSTGRSPGLAPLRIRST